MVSFCCCVSSRSFGNSGIGALSTHSHATRPRVPPEGYKCYKCHQPGHWIQECTYQGPPKGIPDSFKPPPAARTLDRFDVPIEKAKTLSDIGGLPTTTVAAIFNQTGPVGKF